MESIILSGAHQVCQIVNNMPMEHCGIVRKLLVHMSIV